MELRDYLALLAPYRFIIIGLPILLLLFGYLITAAKPSIWEASTTFTVEKPQSVEQSQSSFYQYDQYYAQLAATLFADTIANWLKSPSTVVEIYEKSGLAVPTGSSVRIGKIFRVGKGQSTTVATLTVQDGDRSNALKIAETAKAVVDVKVAELKARNTDPSYFGVVATASHIFEVKVNPLINAILGAITGLIVALVLSFVLAYLYPRKR